MHPHVDLTTDDAPNRTLITNVPACLPDRPYWPAHSTRKGLTRRSVEALASFRCIDLGEADGYSPAIDEHREGVAVMTLITSTVISFDIA